MAMGASEESRIIGLNYSYVAIFQEAPMGASWVLPSTATITIATDEIGSSHHFLEFGRKIKPFLLLF